MNKALRWKLIAGFVLVFMAGAMTGVFFTAMHARRIFVEAHQPNVVSARMKDRLKAELNLTPEQEAKISPIVEKMAAQLEQIRTDTGRRVHETFVNAHREMNANLTDEQRKRLQQMEEHHRPGHLPFGPHGPQHGPHGPPPPGEMRP
jgi:Skp family chaperone for outer membrane proteins